MGKAYDVIKPYFSSLGGVIYDIFGHVTALNDNQGVFRG